MDKEVVLRSSESPEYAEATIIEPLQPLDRLAAKLMEAIDNNKTTSTDDPGMDFAINILNDIDFRFYNG